MKACKTIFFAALLSAAFSLAAAPSFRGAIGGCATGDLTVPLNKEKTWGTIPLAGFAAAQANLAEWAILRGEIAAFASDVSESDIFSDNQAKIRINELSFVLQRRAFTATNYFSLFLGAYEPIGSDAFLMRHFGIEGIASQLTKSYTSLCGSPVRSTKGTGISYIVNFDKAPIATGAYFFFNKNKEGNWAMNLDARFALSSNYATLDFSIGVGAPIQDRYNNNDVVLVIDTISLHGGVDFLLGSKYSHSLFFQAGVEDITVKGKGAGVLDGDEVKLLIEPRINFNTFKFSLTAYSLDKKSVEEFVYLNDPIGAGVTFYKDDIEGKRGDITLGIHAFASLSQIKLTDFLEGKNIGSAAYSAYLTPYAIFPLSATASMETMAQVGVKDIAGDRALKFKIGVGAKKTF